MSPYLETDNYINDIAAKQIGRKHALPRADRRTDRFKDQPMFCAEIQWLASGPTLKLEGSLVADWAEQARSMVTSDILPKGLIVDLTDVTYIDSVGEELLIWLASVGARFVAGNVYAIGMCDKLDLSPVLHIRASQAPGWK